MARPRSGHYSQGQEWVEYGQHLVREATMANKTRKLEHVAIVHPNAGGLDIGAREIWASAPPTDEGMEQVRCYSTFTPDLHRLADWLVGCGVDTVAMEATGVYWVP